MVRKQITLVIAAILLVATFAVIVSAEELPELIITPAASELPFSFSSWFEHTFGVDTFSVVGDAQQCGDNGNADYTFTTSGGDSFTGKASSFCSSGHGIWDVFIGDSWKPYLEFKDLVYIQCNSANTQCNFELYCCPHIEPSTTSNCQSWYGTYSEMKSASCTAWTNPPTGAATHGYKCTTIYGTESSIPYAYSSFKYCTLNEGFDCYYYSGTGTTCSKKTYPESYGSCSTVYSYNGYLLYSSKTTCESKIPTQPVCTQVEGQSCGYTEGVCCVDGLVCEDFLCVKEEESSSKTCSDLGGDICSEEESCSTGGFILSSDSDRCCWGSCEIIQEDTDDITDNTFDTEDVPMELKPVVENERELKGKVQIFDLTYGDAVTGEKITVFTPGQTVKINFKVRALVDIEGYLVEAGIIPISTAGTWNMNKSSGYFQIFNVVENSLKDACCFGQPNIGDNLDYYKYKFLSFKKDQIQEYSYTVQVPDSSTKDLCGSEVYWDGSSNYEIYVTVKNGCYKDGYRKGVFIAKPIILNANDSTTIGKECRDDFDCLPGEVCENIKGDGFLNLKKYCISSGLNENGTSKYLRLPLTKEEISKSTSGDLLASACYYNSDCANRENHTSSCIPIATLVKEGTMTAEGQKDLFSNGKALITTGALGTGIGLALCVGVGAVTAGAALVGCGVAGALIGIASVETLSQIGVGIGDVFSEELQSAIKNGDSNKVGICTAEPKTTAFDVTGFLSKIGDKINITGDPVIDGIIVLVGVFILLSFLLRPKQPRYR